LSYAEPRISKNRDLELIPGGGYIALIAIELERSRLALKNAVVEIRNSENNSNIIDTIPGFVFTLSAAARSSCQSSVLEYFGKTMEGIEELGHQQVVHPDDLLRGRSWNHSIETRQPMTLNSSQRRC